MMIQKNTLITEKLKVQFGEFNHSIKESGDYRITKIKDSQNVLLLLAMVKFVEQYSSEIEIIHSLIKSGALIGRTIINSDYNLIRHHKCTFTIHAAPIFNHETEIIFGQYSDIYVEKNSQKELYCQVCEIFNPDFNHDFPILPQNIEAEKEVIQFLSQCGISYKEIEFLK